ncbi:hypothetical protein Mp_6g07620 [Marchantia polymorpha subsp. ruderalis]|uniref:Uncharacterized protein n=2 Tax=Marchantia polymorpha TaxID=3197 RepID=A0AAF6BPK6_MARPO|nr:hypothetical protein MARPO_0053s0075 [Marchantia polymorpha]BBN13940.1 hypothetical protein Mp_6g07620 [Marchantia polymorpha subsp. ruderalis]|eukprot:PTQ38141.1 hypothetical protein MARPO_0053s0075 [Marchantia polymorpha]
MLMHIFAGPTFEVLCSPLNWQLLEMFFFRRLPQVALHLLFPIAHPSTILEQDTHIVSHNNIGMCKRHSFLA